MALSKVNVSQMTNTSKKNYDRLPLSYPKDFCSSVRAAASEAGESLAGYVKKSNRISHAARRRRRDRQREKKRTEME